MTSRNDILTAMNALIATRYPGNMVYIQRCSKDFARPSFLLEYVRCSQTDASRNTVSKTVYMTITCFAQVDSYYRSDKEALTDLQDNVMQLFSGGCIPVGDRCIKVQSSIGGVDPDRSYVDLQFEYFDERTDSEDTYPLMASVETILQEG